MFKIGLHLLLSLAAWCGISSGEAAALPFASFPVPLLPAPSGRYAIGRKAFDWVDAERMDAFSTARGLHREVMVYIWYPALANKSSVPAEYFPGANVLAQSPATDAIGGDMFGPAWSQIVAGKLRAHAITDASPAKSRTGFPVVLFSHGSSSTCFSYTAQIENLVSHGYVVVAIEHPGLAGLVRFPDGRIRLQQDPTPAPEDANDRMKAAISSAERGTQTGAEDLHFVLDLLFRKQVDLAGMMNLRQVTAVGHSAGGTITARSCQLDQRIKACISEDGEVNPVGIFFDYPDHSQMAQPFLMIRLDEQPSNEQLARMGESRAQWERYLEHGREQMQSCGAGSYQIVLNKPGLVHASFSDGLLIDAVPGSSGAFSAAKNLELTERLEMDFLDSVLGTAIR